MDTLSILSHCNKIYMNYKDIMAVFSLCSTTASRVKNEVAKDIKNQCPYNSQSVLTEAVFKHFNVSLDDYIERLTKIMKIEEYGNEYI